MNRIVMTIMSVMLVGTSFAYYNSEQGRWMNRDPIQEKGSPNLYAFVYNSPGVLVDVNGLEPTSGSLSEGDGYISGSHANCMNYALNRPVGPQIPPSLDYKSKLTCAKLVAAIKKDFDAKDKGENGCCTSGYHEIHIRITEQGNDYHFARKNSDGKWSHVLPPPDCPDIPLINAIDASLNPILNPQQADWDFTKNDWHGQNYSEDCGNFCAKTDMNEAELEEYQKEMQRLEEYSKAMYGK